MTSDSVRQVWPRWLTPLKSSWPCDAPTLREVSLDAVLSELTPDAHQPMRGDDAVLAVLSRDEPAAQIDRLTEGLLEHQIPGVILLEDPTDWRMVQRQGVIFESWNADPRTLAGMLYALCERQQTVRLLGREVQLALRCQGGIRHEMDRLHEELHLAASIQREFTSSPVPRVPGLDISVLFRPVNFVSGDVYNVRDLGDGHAAFLLADAVGHGVPAALLTMVLTSGLNTRSESGALLPPHQVLRALNQRMCDMCLGTGRFATAVYGVIDANSRKVTLAGAGHPLPIVIGNNNSREIETHGPLLGVFDAAEFDQAEFTLDETDSLLLYTDGLEAAFPTPTSHDPKEKRARWLSEMAHALRGQEGNAGARMLTELQLMLDSQAGSLHQGDDVTAVCIAKAA
ncbi:MAG: SpoIIE family protein phosphatase [Tepidisphaera sp.]|nr:SpoIIE family protein phosphatase [Tepidisphaera sp.]